jgi:hypothetical protein
MTPTTRCFGSVFHNTPFFEKVKRFFSREEKMRPAGGPLGDRTSSSKRRAAEIHNGSQRLLMEQSL